MQTVKEVLTENTKIESIERTYQSNKGKWLFIVNIKDKDNVIQFLEETLENIVGGDSKVISIRTKARRTERDTQALGTYTDVLRGFANPHEDSKSGEMMEVEKTISRNRTKQGRDSILLLKQEKPQNKVNRS